MLFVCVVCLCCLQLGESVTGGGLSDELKQPTFSVSVFFVFVVLFVHFSDFVLTAIGMEETLYVLSVLFFDVSMSLIDCMLCCVMLLCLQAGLKGVTGDRVQEVEAVVMRELTRLTVEGFHADDVQASINTIEFHLREC